MISICDMFKVGIGPSSSHTVGPMKAAKQFVAELQASGHLLSIDRLSVEVYGSLALTGRGHHTDIAIILGLQGSTPVDVDIATIPEVIQKVQQQQRLLLQGQYWVSFSRVDGMVFRPECLPLHENGLRFYAWAGSFCVYSNTYYSTGGGFIVDSEHFGQSSLQEVKVPYPFHSASALLEHCSRQQLSIADLVFQNELSLQEPATLDSYLATLWETMQSCIARGLSTEGVLPGPLRVPRRAAALKRLLHNDNASEHHDPLRFLDLVNMYALAVNEENAAGGRVVTAPTNGACGIIPAILAYYDSTITPLTPVLLRRFFLAAGAIGILYKMNASISGAEVGCQGEVGVACSMAAAGLAQLFDASPEQVCVAAEIGMEHNLGLTCDPVAGQVQVPCIERNAIAAVKAINSARMALRRQSTARVSLDKVIETMYETGKDMNTKYRETSQGGLAIKVQCD